MSSQDGAAAPGPSTPHDGVVQAGEGRRRHSRRPVASEPSGRAKPVVVLVGPPGAGKTSTAHELAARLGVTARDTDADVEETAGRPIADIFVESGEATFRELERKAVEAALAGHDGVVALGGGAVLDPHTQVLLADHTVAFLDVRIADAARRIGFNTDRPLLIGNPRAKWTALMNARRPVYERVATIRVETDGRTPGQVADEILTALGGPPGRNGTGAS